ncbi:transcriptional regulator, Fur family [Fulvivirga imtechensis AK7]|uniref:Transcriptional regulator, Fur family n=1 Tax=Fulvivirga imtechensis AK7 TaxID=1237149 RepID=L8JNH8_9BACT|nr:transcriptional regulator, Fur family [Fulvivirga imtechensis AK7]
MILVLSNNYSHIKEKLSEAGLKVTHQRIVIMDSILRLDNHPTVEQIFDLIRDANPSLSLGTVYKTVETFVNNGLLSKVSTNEGQMRYDPKLHNHGHIYCGNTSEIIDYYDEELNDMILNFFKKKKVNNLKIKNITLQINGDKIDPEKDILIK